MSRDARGICGMMAIIACVFLFCYGHWVGGLIMLVLVATFFGD